MPPKNYTRVTVYLTHDEKCELERLATNAGLKLGSYIKRELLGERMETSAHTVKPEGKD